MKRFEIFNQYTQSFRHNITLVPNRSSEELLDAEYSSLTYYTSDIDKSAVKKLIDSASSLSVHFGWSFETCDDLGNIINHCTNNIDSKYSILLPTIVSDTRASWFGFVSYDIFQQISYEKLDIIKLIEFYNQLICYINDFIQEFMSCTIYKHYSIIKNNPYRFDKFRNIRKDKKALAEAYHEYIDAFVNIHQGYRLPIEILEEQIGCHFLYNPDLFFELTDFYILKDVIHG